MALSLAANAKINLHLDVGPRRSDGYHELRTLFQEISLHDELTFTLTDGALQLLASEGVPQGKENIVLQALAMLKRKLKVKKGMAVRLEKKIPVGAGLGGGSADAAAALKAGWTLWKNPAAKKPAEFKKIPPTLHACAEKLGADVAFFLLGGTAWAGGKGEKLEPAAREGQRWIVLVSPRIPISTKDAYRLLDESRKKKPPKRLENRRFNSFEPVIFKKYPGVAQVHKTLLELGCMDVMMSGSGSCVYGFVKSPVEGAEVLNQLQGHSWDVFLAHTV